MKAHFFCLGLTAFLAAPSLHGQSCLSKSCNLFRDGDKLIKQQVEYKNPGRSGESVLWDFSRQEPVDDHYSLDYQAFGDSLLIGKERRTFYKYVISGDTVFSYGFENPTTLVNNIRPEMMLVFPFCFRDKYESYFHGNGDYCNRLFLTVRGRSSVEADAYGVMLLPSGDTLRHVLRVHHSRRIAQRMVPYNCVLPSDTIFSADSINRHLETDSLTLQVETYRWYADGYRYPVFETVETLTLSGGKPVGQSNAAFYYQPADQYYDLGNDLENQQKRDTEQRRLEAKRGQGDAGLQNDDGKEEVITFSTSLSNGGNELILEYYLAGNADVSYMLFDIQGRQLIHNTRIGQSQGVYRESISLYGLQPGEYTLRIVVNGKVFGEKIIK